MRTLLSLLTFVTVGTASTVYAQDSVSKLSGLPGDAVDAYSLNEQVNDYVVDLAAFQSSWGKTFGLAPVVKLSEERLTSPTFFTGFQVAQAMSRRIKSGVPFARPSYSYWNQPGFGVNDIGARNDPGVTIPATSLVGHQLALATVESSSGNPTTLSLRNIVGATVNFTDNTPSRLYVSRVIAAQNAPTETCSLASFGLGAIDEDGNIAVRADGNSIAAAGCGGTPLGQPAVPPQTGTDDENYFTIDLSARSTATLNVISELYPGFGGDPFASQRVLTNLHDTINAPNMIPESVAGRRIVIGSDFLRRYLFEQTAGTVVAAAANAHFTGLVSDHRGAVAYTTNNFTGLFAGSVAGTAGIQARPNPSVGLTTSLDLWGLAANGNFVSPISFVLPTVMTDPVQTWSNTNVAGSQEFDHHHSQTAFQGGSSQLAMGRDQAGNLLLASVVYYGFTPPVLTPFTNPNNYVAVARVNPTTAAVTWSVAAWTQEGGTAVSDGKTIFQNGTTPIGRLRAFSAVGGGPTMSAPMFDSVGNVWFLGAYELTATPGTISTGLLRAVYDAATFSYKLELVLAQGAVFAGRNSGKNYRVSAIDLRDTDSVSSGTAFSGNITEASYKNLSTVGMTTDDARTLGGVVVAATIVYDMNADGLYLPVGTNPGSPDEDYRVLLYVTAAVDCNANGISDDVEIADGLAADSNANGIPDSCEGIVGTPYCFGDGAGTACPCGNVSLVGDKLGCLNSLALGGKLRASGVATVGSDTVVLAGSQVPNGPGLYFQGTTQLGAGNGVVFGDGLRCTGGSVIRLGIVTASGNASTYPSGTGVNSIPVSIKGLVVPGNTRNYQLWYRDSAAFCTPSVFNLTNGLTLVWN